MASQLPGFVAFEALVSYLKNQNAALSLGKQNYLGLLLSYSQLLVLVYE